MAVNFKDITIEGFGSIIKRTTYRLDLPGFNVIVGRNGHGKTTIPSALYWCLYKKPLKKNSSINPWPLVIEHSPEYRGTFVQVRYEKDGVERLIIHCNEYSGEIFKGIKGKKGLFIIKGGKVLNHLRDKIDGWQWIVDDIGYSAELFKSSIIFGQKVKRIMEEDGPTRNKILEEAYEIAYISKAKNKIDQILRDSKPLLREKERDLENLASLLAANQILIDNFKIQKSQFEENKENKIKQYKKVIREAKIEIEELNKSITKHKANHQSKILKLKKKIGALLLKGGSITKLKSLGDDEFKLMLEVNRVETSLDTLKDKKQTLISDIRNIPRKCDKCGQKMDPNHIKELRANTKKTINLIIKDIKGQELVLTTVRSKHQAIKNDIASLQKRVDRISKIKTKISLLEAKENDTRELYDELPAKESLIEVYTKLIKEQETSKFKGSIKEPKKKVKSLNRKLSIAKETYEELKSKIEIDEWLVKDPLSNSGLKAFIFDKLLRVTNRELSNYEHILGYKIKLSIALESKRKDFNLSIFIDGQEVPHKDLSGGQMQLGDVCIALAIHDTIGITKGCNILFFDEVFESLDDENIEKVGEILQYKAKGKNIHLITHLKNFNPVNANYTFVKLNKRKQTIIRQEAA